MKVLKKIAQRIRRLANDERGDTIAETLVAVLIAALGAAALATMVMVAVSVSTSMGQERSRIYTAEGSMQPTSNDSQGSLSIAVDGKATEFKVRIYQDPDGTFISYTDESVSAG